MKADGIVLEPVRAILRVESLLLLGLLIAFYWWMHANWIVFVILLLAPDIAMLGYLRNTQFGAFCYNVFHTLTAPFALGVAALIIHPIAPFAIIWAAHIAMDRALGYGLKYSDSFAHTHLGFIGKRSKDVDALQNGEG